MTDDMIDRAAAAIKAHDVYLTGGYYPDEEYHAFAVAALNAALPVVWTVAALDALPVGVRLLGADGSVWERERGVPPQLCWIGMGHVCMSERADVFEHAPLRVIRMPEVAA